MIIETRDFRLSLIHKVACNEEEDIIFHLIQNHFERRRLLDQVHPSIFDRLSGYPIPSFIIFRHRLLPVPLLVTSEQSNKAFREYLIICLQTLGSPLLQFIRTPTYFAVVYDL